jgi:transcriptional regulator
VYQPAHGRFTVSDPAAVLADLLERSPATLVTASAAGFRTTILPMLVERAGEGAADPIDVSADPDRHVLRGHIARGNPQWRDLEDGASAVAIVLGPDAYVTPAWYAEKRRTGKVVPTWNYTAVSAHGTLRIRHEPEWLLAHVRTLVDRHERTRREPWSVDDAPPDFVATQPERSWGSSSSSIGSTPSAS